MAVARVARGHQALVQSRPGATPAATPTFRLLGSRRPIGTTASWDEQYKRAQDITVDPALLRAMQAISRALPYDPATNLYTPDERATIWAAHPSLAAQRLADFGRMYNSDAALTMAASIAPGEAPQYALPGTKPRLDPSKGNLSQAVIDVADLATSGLPIARGWKGLAVQQGPTAASILTTPRPEVRLDLIRSGLPLLELQAQRAVVPDHSSEARVLDQQIEQQKPQWRPALATNSTGEQLADLGFGAVRQAASGVGAVAGGPLHPLFPVGAGLYRVSQNGWKDPGAQDLFIKGTPTAAAQYAGIRYGNNPLGRQFFSASRPLVSLPEVTAGTRLGRLAQGVRGGFTTGLRAAPTVGLMASAADSLYSGIRSSTDEGQAELEKAMVPIALERERHNPLYNAGKSLLRAGGGLLGQGWGDTQAEIAYDMARATGTPLPAVDEAFQQQARSEWYNQRKAQLEQEIAQIMPGATPATIGELARAAADRHAQQEFTGQRADPEYDVQRIRQRVDEAAADGLIQPPNEHAMSRLYELAQAVGPDAVYDTLFVPQGDNQRVLNRRNIEALDKGLDTPASQGLYYQAKPKAAPVKTQSVAASTPAVPKQPAQQLARGAVVETKPAPTKPAAPARAKDPMPLGTMAAAAMPPKPPVLAFPPPPAETTAQAKPL